jgi:DNA repair protein RadC
MEIRFSKRPRPKITDPECVYNLLLDALRFESEIDQDKEHFWVIGLNTKNQVVFLDLVTLGILNASLYHPREVFRLAVMKGVFSIIIAHNHPSGDPTPSEEDKRSQSQLKEAGHILGIEILDDLIITNGQGWYSFAQNRRQD